MDCSIPLSYTRKSARVRPVMAVPSEVKTLQVTGTICVLTRIVALPDDALLPFSGFELATGPEESSPVAGSRCQTIPESSWRGRGNFCFCCALGEISENGLTSAAKASGRK